MTRRALTVATLLVSVGVSTVVSAGAALAGCSDRFPDEAWQVAGQTELLTVSTVSVPEGQALRFADDAAATMALLETELGAAHPIELCIAGRDADLDGSGIVPENERLHSVVFNEDGTVVIDVLEAAFFDEAHAFGLAYATLWGVAAESGSVGYPEPLATTIGQWYLSRAADKLELHHSQMRSGAFFRDPSGQGVDTTDWTAGSQPPVYPWNPQFQESPLADLVAYAVATEGAEILRDPSQERWMAVEQAWQEALRQEALQGSSSGNAWLIGLAIVAGLLTLAGVLAWLNHLAKRRFKDEARPKTSR